MVSFFYKFSIGLDIVKKTNQENGTCIVWHYNFVLDNKKCNVNLVQAKISVNIILEECLTNGCI